MATRPGHDRGQRGLRTAPGLYLGGLCSIGRYGPLASPRPPPVKRIPRTLPSVRGGGVGSPYDFRAFIQA